MCWKPVDKNKTLLNTYIWLGWLRSRFPVDINPLSRSSSYNYYTQLWSESERQDILESRLETIVAGYPADNFSGYKRIFDIKKFQIAAFYVSHPQKVHAFLSLFHCLKKWWAIVLFTEYPVSSLPDVRHMLPDTKCKIDQIRISGKTLLESWFKN